MMYFTNRDSALLKVYNYVNHGWPNIIEEQLKPFFRRRDELSCENLCIQWGGRVIIPAPLRSKVLSEIQDNHHKNQKSSSFILMVDIIG